MLAVAHPWASASSYLSSQSLANSRCMQPSFHPAVVPPTLVVLPPVASSSVAPLSSASFCDAAAACRSLALAASPAPRRSSALLAAYFGPSSLSSSPLARTTLLTPTPIICRHVMLLLRSTLSSITCTFIVCQAQQLQPAASRDVRRRLLAHRRSQLRRLARKVARGSVDRTAYSPKYSLSFMSHHAERIYVPGHSHSHYIPPQSLRLLGDD